MQRKVTKSGTFYSVTINLSSVDKLCNIETIPKLPQT